MQCSKVSKNGKVFKRKIQHHLFKDKLPDLDKIFQLSLERSFSRFSFVQFKQYNKLGDGKADTFPLKFFY